MGEGERDQERKREREGERGGEGERGRREREGEGTTREIGQIYQERGQGEIEIKRGRDGGDQERDGGELSLMACNINKSLLNSDLPKPQPKPLFLSHHCTI